MIPTISQSVDQPPTHLPTRVYLHRPHPTTTPFLPASPPVNHLEIIKFNKAEQIK